MGKREPIMTRGTPSPDNSIPADLSKKSARDDKKVFSVLLKWGSLPLLKVNIRGEYVGNEDLECAGLDAAETVIRESKGGEFESCRMTNNFYMCYNKDEGRTLSGVPYKIGCELQVRIGTRIDDIAESTLRSFNEQVLTMFTSLYKEDLGSHKREGHYDSFKMNVISLYALYQEHFQGEYNKAVYAKLLELDNKGVPLPLHCDIQKMSSPMFKNSKKEQISMVEDVQVVAGSNGFVDALRELFNSCSPIIEYIKPVLGMDQVYEIFQADTIRASEVEKVQTRLEIISNEIGCRYSTIPEWSAGIKAHYSARINDVLKKLRPPATVEMYEVWKNRYERFNKVMNGHHPKAVEEEELLRRMVPACNPVEGERVNYLYQQFKDVAPMLGVPLIRPVYNAGIEAGKQASLA